MEKVEPEKALIMKIMTAHKPACSTKFEGPAFGQDVAV